MTFARRALWDHRHRKGAAIQLNDRILVILATYLNPNTHSFDALIDEGLTIEDCKMDGDSLLVTMEPMEAGDTPFRVRLVITEIEMQTLAHIRKSGIEN